LTGCFARDPDVKLLIFYIKRIEMEKIDLNE